ncbi:hypothetical protein D3C81_2330030 [compost metagenome]
MQHFTVYRCRHNAAVIAGEWQFIKCYHRQTFRFIRIAVIDSHLRTKGIEISV